MSDLPFLVGFGSFDFSARNSTAHLGIPETDATRRAAFGHGR
jgi:hypothetical protein